MSNHDQALGKWPNAPLALVLAQIRFDPEVDTEYKEVAARLKSALGERFPAMKAVRQVTLVFGNAPVPAEESKANEGEVGRELRSDDNRSALRVQDGVMTYTTSLYKDSPQFLAEWRSMLDCLCAAGGVKVLRLGLRYVDFIIPNAGKVPEDYFKDGFSHSTGVLGEVAQTTFISHEYPRGGDGAMRVQYGRGFALPSLPPDLDDGSVQIPPALLKKYTDGPSAVLDIDRWRVDSRRLQAEDIAGEFQRLRDDISMAFRRIIKPEAVAEWTGQPA
ncbi:MAG: TIGR04255 family protein [Gammaproteobacteria bacterium]|nr:TIGR04255 family protein [Gammaproteobacteria bacterium]MBU3989842.1 TIGR04255 family protein [Gammaproteobacteria bacterium]MBU4004372.1 TIGR04255 family protein [Gammaproteobacteria bacterium]MBU4019781.1 TIGR04255 family protein [Gammaproteobacteria bacterium]MBU4097400.1 TIGR04255 family protein [Gammaproteobacteria bacterium]